MVDAFGGAGGVSGDDVDFSQNINLNYDRRHSRKIKTGNDGQNERRLLAITLPLDNRLPEGRMPEPAMTSIRI